MQTETGTPVQFLEWNFRRQGWDIRPAVIFAVEAAKVDILLLEPGDNTLILNVNNYDFLKAGESCWRHIPQKKGGQYQNFIPVKK